VIYGLVISSLRGEGQRREGSVGFNFSPHPTLSPWPLNYVATHHKTLLFAPLLCPRYRGKIHPSMVTFRGKVWPRCRNEWPLFFVACDVFAMPSRLKRNSC
jgi:hypothetical protein